MEKLQEFPLDKWIHDEGPKCNVHFSASCVKPVSLAELRNLAPKPTPDLLDANMTLEYGDFRGSLPLRTRIAQLYSTPEAPLTAENVVVCPGSNMANFLLLQTLCSKGDHVICQYPTFGPLYLIPRHFGVHVSLWAMAKDKAWLPDLGQLAAMIRPNTKAIILNNPNNPTGTVLSRDFLLQVVEIARKANVTVFCDEVFAPLFHSGPVPPPLVSLGYENSVSTGSMSKAYGLPGVRVGWVLSRNQALLRQILAARGYTTVSVSLLDQAVTAFALDRNVLVNLIARSHELCGESIRILSDFVDQNKRCRWMQPPGGGVGFIQILDQNGQPVDDLALARKLVQQEALCLVPGGHSFADQNTSDLQGYFRFPLGDPETLRKGLPLLQKSLDQ